MSRKGFLTFGKTTRAPDASGDTNTTPACHSTSRAEPVRSAWGIEFDETHRRNPGSEVNGRSCSKRFAVKNYVVCIQQGSVRHSTAGPASPAVNTNRARVAHVMRVRMRTPNPWQNPKYRLCACTSPNTQIASNPVVRGLGVGVNVCFLRLSRCHSVPAGRRACRRHRSSGQHARHGVLRSLLYLCSHVCFMDHLGAG